MLTKSFAFADFFGQRDMVEQERVSIISGNIELYSLRWWVVFFLAVDFSITKLVRGSFGIVSNVYAAYFQISILTVDWFTLIQLPTMFIFTSLMLLFPLENTSNKKLSTIMAGCVIFTVVCLLASYCYPPLYPLIFVGMFVMGLSVISVDIVFPVFTLKWFPENQIGIALNLKEVFGSIGGMLGFLIPGNILISPLKTNSFPMMNCTNTTVKNQDDNWSADNKLRLIAFSGTLLTLSIIVLLFLIFFAADQPPKPPTIAQAMLRNNAAGIEPQSFYSRIVVSLKTVKKVILNTFFAQIIFVCAVNYSGYAICKAYVGEVLRELFEKISDFESANAHSSYVLVVYEVGCVVGSLLSGKITHRYQNYHIQISIGILFCILSLISVFIGYYFLIPVVVYIAIGFSGVFSMIYFAQTFDIVYQHFFPIDSGILTVLLYMVSSGSGLIFTSMTKLFMSAFGNDALFIYMIILYSLSFAVSLFLKPNYARLKVGTNCQDVNNIDEREFLITEDR